MRRLTEEEIAQALRALVGWEREGDTFVRRLTFPSFAAAVQFVIAVADRAERANHHPDMTIQHRRVTLVLTTHDTGGLTERDVALAREITALAGGAA